MLSLLAISRPVVRDNLIPIIVFPVKEEVQVELLETTVPASAVRVYVLVLKVELGISPLASLQVSPQNKVSDLDVSLLVRAASVLWSMSVHLIDGVTGCELLFNHLIPGLLRLLFIGELVFDRVWSDEAKLEGCLDVVNIITFVGLVGEVANAKGEGASRPINHLLHYSVEKDLHCLVDLLLVLTLTEDSIRDSLAEKVPGVAG